MSWTILIYFPRIIIIKITKRAKPSLQEKILLSTTSINKCILCARFASVMAMKDGVNVEEVLTILNMDLKESNKCTEDEKTALLFAQNYAENFNTPVQNFLLARALLM